MSNLSDHDLKQMDEAWQVSQAEPVVRGLLKRALDDLRVARDRLNQGPGNSSRPPGSMPPWLGKHRYAKPQDAAEPPDQTPQTDAPALPVVSPVPAGEATPAPAEDAASPSPAAPDQPVTAKTPGRPGRRVGAVGHGREQKLLPTVTQKHHPLSCAACQLSLESAPAQAWTGWDTLEMQPLQATDAAPAPLGIRIEVTRHLLMQATCACGHITRACAQHPEPDSLWPGVESSEQRLLGPRLAAAIVHLCVRMHLPRRKVAELLLEWFGLEISPALIDQTVHQAARAVAPLEAQLVAELEQAVLVHADETSWPEAGNPLWLWVVCCATTVVYMIGSRGKELFDNALNVAYLGTLMSDGYTVYRGRLKRLRCWAHLLRKLIGVSQSTDAAAGQIGARMLKALKDLMDSIYEARKREITPENLPAVTHAAQLKQLRQDCEDHKDHAHPGLRAIAREFINDWEVIIKPLSDPHLPLTNNAAEQQLRQYVIARRISYGTRTPVGSRGFALLASVFDTCRLRQASATALLAAAIHALRTGLAAPVLPPIPPGLAG